jgi:putative transcriptional regulator
VNPRHHPSDDVLATYAAGASEPGFGLVVGAHVEACAHCRAKVAAFEAAAGAALKDIDVEEPVPEAFARLLARIDSEPVAPMPQLDTRPLIERLPLKPRKWIAPGVWVAGVKTPHAPNNRVYLLSVAPGMPTARHEHSGAEYCTVLKGSYQDELGLFAAGDFAATNEEVNHQPVVQGAEDCVCLFATEGRLKPQGFLGRLAFAYADV